MFFYLITGDFSVSPLVFSGVPDPEWTFTSSDPNYHEILTLVGDAIQNNLAFYPENIPAILGYKGILVAPVSSKKKAVVQGLTEERLIVGPQTVKLQMLLFKSMPKGVLPDDLSKEISKNIASGSVNPKVSPRRAKRYAPPFVNAPWATRNRQLKNNCYNYATTKPTNTFAQPGRATTNQFYPDPVTFNNLRNLSVSDGLAVLNVAPTAPAPANPPLPNQNHVVALVIWEST